jgi:arylsulfatase A-like enzyme
MRSTLFFLSILIAPACSHAQERPNIIYIMADDLGYADLSGYGRKDYQTPNLDKLATSGMKFMHAYAAAPLCTPSRTAFMTGRYPARTPVGLKEPLEWSVADSMAGLTPEYPSIARLLQQAGYSTHLVGKWHLGFSPPFSPILNGFDEFYGSKGGGVDYISHTSPSNQNDLFENDLPAKKESGYMTHLLMNKSVDIIRRKHDKPFFLSIMFNAPHWPWQAPGDTQYALGAPSWRAGGSAATFGRMMKALDEAVGTIINTLAESGQLNNTFIIFTSDNGGERYSNMGEFTGAKPVLWEGGIRVPAFVSWAGIIPPGIITDQPVITMDWSATILSLAMAKEDPKFPLDGVNLLPFILSKEKINSRSFYWRVFQRNQQKAIREGNWKYLQDEKGEYLFDISKDPAEKNNRMDDERIVFARLKQKFLDWEKTVLEPIALRKN